MSKMTAAAATAAMVMSAALLAQAPCHETNLGTNLGLTADDGGTAVALGFAFPFNGVPYTDLNVCTNGFVWLGATPPAVNPWDYTPTETELLTEPPRIAPFWMDLNLPNGGNIFFNTFPASPGVAARAVITWDQVPWYGSSTVVMTIQLQLEDNGAMQWSIASTGGAPNSTEITGFSQGAAATSNPIDFSVLPANTGLFPTVHETFTSAASVDVLGQSFQAVPNGTNGHLVLAMRQCRQAGVSTYGAGCPVLSAVAVYEQFANTTFDLSNSSLLFIPNGNSSYTVVPGPNTWFAGFTNNLALVDDSTAAVTLPYPFPHAGGVTSTASVSSNGFVWLGSNTNSACCTGNSASFLSEPMARIAALWMDLNPTLGGGVYADLDGASGEYVITWSGVPEHLNVTNLINMQVALQPSGIFELRFQANTNVTHQALTGYSMGAVSNDPGNSDFSTLPIVTGTSQTIPPVLLAPQAGSLPRIGSTFVAAISDLPPGSLLAVYMISFARANLDLSPFGMPGCTAWVDVFTPGLSAQIFVPVLNPILPVSMNIPNSARLVGFNVYTQAAVIAPGINALGMAASNGLLAGIGT